MKTGIDHRQAAVAQWTSEPAGAVLANDHPRGSRAFFEEVTRQRYALYPWLLDEYLRQPYWRAKRVLEVGVGLGTDHLQLRRMGAELTGIDLTPASIAYTTRRFELEAGEPPRVCVADAEDLPFPAGSFDAVYSFGVLHHTPDLARAIEEVRRVLKPGGRALVGVYNRHSYFYAQRLLRHGLTGGWREKSLAQMRGGFEFGDGEPHVAVLGRRELLELSVGFSAVSLEARHLPTNRLPPRMRPRADRVLRPLERRVGWYWILDALSQ